MAGPETREAAHREYSSSLGEAFFRYVYGTPSTPQEKEQNRARFAEEIVEAFEHPWAHGARILAVTALLEAVETQIAPGTRRGGE